MSYDLFKNLTTDDVILTVNQRLTTHLHTQYAHHQTTQCPNPVWQTPNILPLSAWLTHCWQTVTTQTHISPLLLLKPQQELALWEQIIAQDIHQTDQLLSLNATAKMAKQAWQLACQWQINYRDALFTETEDYQTWQRWAIAFAQTCSQNAWLDSASLPSLLIKAIHHKQIKLPKRLFLLGFDEINPAQQNLFNAIEATGCKVSAFSPPDTTATCHVTAAINPEAEIYAMAHWAKQHYATQRIACIVPNLNEIRSQINDIFTEVLVPQILLPEQTYETLPFNISAGIALTDFPLIRSLFQLLKLQPVIPLQQLRNILLSPHLAGAEQEINARAQLDVYLHQKSERQLQVHQLLVDA
jgi:hypothetical protein